MHENKLNQIAINETSRQFLRFTESNNVHIYRNNIVGGEKHPLCNILLLIATVACYFTETIESRVYVIFQFLNGKGSFWATSAQKAIKLQDSTIKTTVFLLT